MASITVTVNETPAPRLIAPPLHTVLLIALFLVLRWVARSFNDTLTRSQKCCNSIPKSCPFIFR